MNIIFKSHKEKAVSFLNSIRDKKGIFICTVAHTETSSIPGISAAGASTDMIKFTPAADVEAIYYGKVKCTDTIPKNPVGPPSPVIITIAALEFLQIPFLCLNAGVKVTPEVPFVDIGSSYGESIETGKALYKHNIENILEKTKIFAKEIAKSYDFIVLGESVPGGTTTAMALINALGFNASNRISGSMPGNQHELKNKVVSKALSYINSNDSIWDIVKKICDPMQPVQAAFAIEAAKNGCKVILAGGTQMLSVGVLISKIDDSGDVKKNILIATTKWVTEDNFSNINELIKELNLPYPFISANLDFTNSKHKNLQLYEEGYVKEGVGAGGLATIVFNNVGIDNQTFLDKIEEVYEKIF